MPEPVGDVTSAKAIYHSPYGNIKAEWKKDLNNFELKVEIPANCTATVYIPAGKLSSVTESNKKINNLVYKNERSVVKIGSGIFHFIVKN
jgi:hypothetical protein